jgi:hypothetical protein
MTDDSMAALKVSRMAGPKVSQKVGKWVACWAGETVADWVHWRADSRADYLAAVWVDKTAEHSAVMSVCGLVAQKVAVLACSKAAMTAVGKDAPMAGMSDDLLAVWMAALRAGTKV